MQSGMTQTNGSPEFPGRFNRSARLTNQLILNTAKQLQIIKFMGLILEMILRNMSTHFTVLFSFRKSSKLYAQTSTTSV